MGAPLKCSEAIGKREASSLRTRARVTVALAAALFLGCGSSTGSVGAVLGKNVHDGRLYVREVPPAMGAAYAGLREGDEIVAIDGEPTQDLSPAQVHAKLSGKIGTKVTLLVRRAGTTRKVEVERGPLAPAEPEPQ